MIDRFRSLLGDEAAWEVAAGGDVERELGSQVTVALAPRSAQECAACLRVAAERRLAVVPWGGGQHQRLGNVPRADVLLVTTGMNGIVDHDAADQTLVAGAGTRLADLVARVREQHQFLPLDPAGMARATIGGVVAAGINGPLRHGHGLPRDVLLGTFAAHPDGKLTRSGGRLVKNVTGYDLHRLYHGSLGTLAVLCEVNLRLSPLPEREQTLAVAFDDLDRLDQFLLALRRSGRPAASLVVAEASLLSGAPLGALPERAGVYVVLIRLHGNEVSVDDAVCAVKSLFGGRQPLACLELTGAGQDLLWKSYREAFAGFAAGVLVKLSVLPFAGGASVLGGVVESLVALAAGAGREGLVTAEPGLGLVRLALAEPPDDELLARLRAFADPGAGRLLTVESAPAAWRRGRNVYPDPLPGERAARAVKAALDPGDVLSPGRMFPEAAR